MDERQEMKRHFSRLGGIYFIFTILSFGVSTLIGGLVRAAAPQLLENSAVALVISMLPLYGIAIPLCALMLRTVPAEAPEKKKMSVGQFLCCIPIAFATMYLGNIFGLVLTAVIGAVKGSAVTNDIVELVTGTNMWGTFLVAVLIAPMMEEFLFRKLIVDRSVKYGEGVAVVLSGLMFGLFHGNLNQFFYAFLLGMLFAFIYVKTGNIWYTVILHMIVNFFGSVVSVQVLKLIDLEALTRMEEMGAAALADPEQLKALLPSLLIYGLYMMFILGLLLAGVVLFLVFRKRFVLNAGEIVLPKKEKRRLVLGNVGMILYILIWVVLIVRQFMM